MGYISLIGNIGGYIGLCLGYSFLQIPDFILYVVEKLKRYYFRMTKMGESSRVIVSSHGLRVLKDNDIEEPSSLPIINEKFSEQIMVEIRKLQDQMNAHSLALESLKDK